MRTSCYALEFSFSIIFRHPTKHFVLNYGFLMGKYSDSNPGIQQKVSNGVSNKYPQYALSNRRGNAQALLFFTCSEPFNRNVYVRKVGRKRELLSRHFLCFAWTSFRHISIRKICHYFAKYYHQFYKIRQRGFQKDHFKDISHLI